MTSQLTAEYTLSESDAQRFWSKVDKTSDCWTWTGSHFKQTGYALFNVKMTDGVWRPTTAHRVAYRLSTGPIPDGLVLDHLCRNRWCVNPAHLEPVTRGENVLRGEGRSAQQARWTECPRGHSFDGPNTYIRPSGKRECRTCMNARESRRPPRKRRKVSCGS